MIPLIFKHIDVIAASKSGTGKTASYVLPMLNILNNSINEEKRVLRGLVLVPTRELVEQVSKSFSVYGKNLKVRHTKIQGGVSRTIQKQKLSTGIDVIVATSGRLKDLIKDEVVSLQSVNFIVLDEVDTMLDMGFVKDIEELLAQCSLHRQICMFSATISQNMRKLAKEFLKDPVVVEVHNRRDTVSYIKHLAYKVDVKKKNEMLVRLLKETKHKQILLFINTKEMANELQAYLVENKINSSCIHGDIEYKNRVKAIKDFRTKKIQVLLATDIAARGLDIKELPLVINFTLPESSDEFTHRVGRTGRACTYGEVITILTVRDYNKFTKIQRNLKLEIKREVYEGFDLKDRQPRQKIMKKMSLSEKKGLNKKEQDKKENKKQKDKKSKKTTKRDKNKHFRKFKSIK